MLFFANYLLGVTKAYSSTTQQEREMLIKYANGRKSVAEIGVYHGVNTANLANAMDSSGVLFAIDPFFKGKLGFSSLRVIAMRETKRKASGRTIAWLRCLGHEAPERLAAYGCGLVEFLFIDGDHSYQGLERDWRAWRRYIAIDGIVAFHDSIPNVQVGATDDTGSVRYVRDVVSIDPLFKRIDRADSLSVFQRVGM